MEKPRWIMLSHVFGATVPVYGDTHAHPGVEAVKSIRAGDSANVFRITLENHWGTHCDAPAHFFDHGNKVADLTADEWVFSHPRVVEVTVGPGELVGAAALQSLDTQCDLVLLRSGFQRHRGEDIYSHDNPGVHAEVGFWLRANRPRVRALGIDFVSLSARCNRQAGRESHQAFLDPMASGRPILVIEDMDLAHPLTRLTQVIVAPLRLLAIDSAPCTVLGRLD